MWKDEEVGYVEVDWEKEDKGRDVRSFWFKIFIKDNFNVFSLKVRIIVIFIKK